MTIVQDGGCQWRIQGDVGIQTPPPACHRPTSDAEFDLYGLMMVLVYRRSGLFTDYIEPNHWRTPVIQLRGGFGLRPNPVTFPRFIFSNRYSLRHRGT